MWPLEFFSTYFFDKLRRRSSGFGMIEVIIGTAIFLIVAVGVYSTFAKLFEVVKISHAKITAIALANEQFEIARNLSYSDVGSPGSLPNGKIPHVQTISRDGIEFEIITTVRNIDDPFDGKLGGTPNDMSPADYKVVEVSVDCSICKNFQPIILTTNVAPKNLETNSTNGALFIKVFDASGQPVMGADVKVENREIVPNIVINDVTDINGMLQIVDAPPGIEAYKITVSKTGYSSEQTYPVGDLANPNPIKPNATVAVQQVTQISFAIDKVSTLNLASVDETCQSISDVGFNISGSKIIGQNPDVLKYTASSNTGSLGQITMPDLEWDNYNISVVDSNSSYDLLGLIPTVPIQITPNSTHNVKFVMKPKDPISLLISVKDRNSGLPLSGAIVTVNGNGVSSSKISGQGSLIQSDWIGGPGQDDFVDETKYFSDDGLVDTATSSGQILLARNGDEYFQNCTLVSSSFDVGSPSNFFEISWAPFNQPAETGADSVKIQIATNNDKLTWNFAGPDGTDTSYYTIANRNIHAVNNGNQYFRYKIFLHSDATSTTPIVSDTSFTFTSACVPPGQAMFGGLLLGSYDVEVVKTGYQIYQNTINVSSSGILEVLLDSF